MSTAARRPRILIADDHKLVVEGLRKLLQEEFEVVGTVAGSTPAPGCASGSRRAGSSS